MSGSLTPDSSSPSPSPPTPPNLHQNTIDPSAKWLIQKFGGTSVGKFPVQIASNIVPYVHLPKLFCNEVLTMSRNYIDQYKVAVVCSARSGSTKALGTTNLLLRAAAEALTRPPRNKPAGTPGFMSPVPKPFEYSASPPESRQSPSAGSPHPGFGSLTSLSASPNFIDTVDLLRREHLAAASDAVKDPIILKELEAEIERDCEWLRGFLSAAQVSPFDSVCHWSDV